MLKPIQTLCVVPAVLLSALILSLQASQISGQTYVVNGHRIEVTLVPDKQSIMLGEPAYLSFVVQNNSEQDLQVVVGGDYRNALGRPESFTVTVNGEGGKSVPQPDAGQVFGGLVGPQNLPAKGRYTFRLFLPHWATFEEAGTYSITAKRVLHLSESGTSMLDLGKKMDIRVQATTNIEVVPLDKEKIGEVIAALGDTMFSGQPLTSESAARTLSYIEDERVIPYFVMALKKRSYDLKFRSLIALGKFNSEIAFQALQKGMETQGRDIENTTTIELANQLAENIRHAAAAALARSPHPGAIPFLLSKRDDTSEAVRITILHVLGKMKPEEAIPILQEMSRDENKRVSDEAKRYLKLLSDKTEDPDHNSAKKEAAQGKASTEASQ